MAPQVLGTPRSPAHRERGSTVDERSIDYGEYRGEQDHPHACMDGYVYLGYTVFDEEAGEEVERVEALPCRRCGEAERSEHRA
jgi:hypothetical protein